MRWRCVWLMLGALSSVTAFAAPISKMQLGLGFDFGTSGVRAVLVDAATKSVQHMAELRWPEDPETGKHASLHSCSACTSNTLQAVSGDKSPLDTVIAMYCQSCDAQRCLYQNNFSAPHRFHVSSMLMHSYLLDLLSHVALLHFSCRFVTAAVALSCGFSIAGSSN
jgi:hypothetical protein